MCTTSYSARSPDSRNTQSKKGNPKELTEQTSSHDKKENAQRLEKVLSQIRREIRIAVKQSGLNMVRARFDTSDIVQESMLQIWKQLGDNDVENLEFTRGLLSVIAKGHARKQMRFHTAKKRSVSREKSKSGPTATREPNPLENADIREQIGLMLGALNHVHPVRQLIIFRRFFDDASYQEIANELCRTKEWVRQQCLSAQKEIRILLMHRS